MAKESIIDARGGDSVIIAGDKLRMIIRARIKAYQEEHEALLKRMNNELPDKETAITLMVALAVNDTTVKAQVLFFKACIDRAAFLDREIRALNTLGQTYADSQIYMVTVADCARYGL